MHDDQVQSCIDYCALLAGKLDGRGGSLWNSDVHRNEIRRLDEALKSL